MWDTYMYSKRLFLASHDTSITGGLPCLHLFPKQTGNTSNSDSSLPPRNVEHKKALLPHSSLAKSLLSSPRGRKRRKQAWHGTQSRPPQIQPSPPPGYFLLRSQPGWGRRREEEKHPRLSLPSVAGGGRGDATSAGRGGFNDFRN